MDRAIELGRDVCRLAGAFSLSAEIEREMLSSGVTDAVRSHETSAIFSYFMTCFSLQGISDRVALAYQDAREKLEMDSLASNSASHCGCDKLASFWHFKNCRYIKSAFTCGNDPAIHNCAVPAHDLRNGRLNQTAYSLFLFIRDVADGDIVAWFDAQLSSADHGPEHDRIRRMRDAVLNPMSNIYGVSFKVLSMALADLMMGVRTEKPKWFEVGASMIAVDTLVHNFLHRTGIADELGSQHRYGPACYQTGGCANIIETLSAAIDARQFNRFFPQYFPRFVQHAIWRYCAQGGLDICNGNRIDDRERCQNRSCRVFDRCERRSLSASPRLLGISA